MKLGFYISMGVAISGLVIGFILLNDVQQENENPAIWIQKTLTPCNNIWGEEYDEFYKINPDLLDGSKEESKRNLEIIIKNHYEKQGITILNLNLEIEEQEEISCDECNCLIWDNLSIQIPEQQLELLPKNEVWKDKKSV